MIDANPKAGANAPGPEKTPAARRASRAPFLGGLITDSSGGLFAIFLTLLVLGLALYHNHRTVGRLVEHIITVEEPTSAAAYKMEVGLLAAGVAVMKYVSTGDPRHREQVRQEEGEFHRFRLQYEGLAETQPERELGRRIDALHDQYGKVGQALMDLRDEQAALGAGQEEKRNALHEALRARQVEFFRLRSQIDDLFDKRIHMLARRDLAAVRTEARNTIRRLHRASVTLLMANAMVCALAAAAILHRSLQLNEEMKLRQASESARAQLFKQLVSIQEEERGRLARELHDQLGQELSALMLGLKGLERSQGQNAQFSSLHAQLQGLARRLIEQLHTIAWELRPAALDDLGLHGALGSYVEDWTRRSGVPVDFQSELQGQRLPGPVETTLYRVAQEALTNCMKHAQARSVSIVLQRRGRAGDEVTSPEVVMVIEDDGRGFAPAEILASSSNGRLGLLGMKERVNLAGGLLEVESAPGAGATLMVRIPVAADR